MGSKLERSRAVLVLLALCCLAAAMPATAQPAGAAVRIRLYNLFGFSGADLQEAMRQAAILLADAGVTPIWRECRTPKGPSAAAAPCDDLPLPFELLVRIVNIPGPVDAGVALGEAHVDSGTGRGALATIFGNRVTLVASDARLGRGVLLGRVLAHELGHLLLGATTHSDDGLMRARWPVADLRVTPPGEWRFAAGDADRIRILVGARAQLAERDARPAGAWRVPPR